MQSPALCLWSRSDDVCPSGGPARQQNKGFLSVPGCSLPMKSLPWLEMLICFSISGSESHGSRGFIRAGVRAQRVPRAGM